MVKFLLEDVLSATRGSSSTARMTSLRAGSTNARGVLSSRGVIASSCRLLSSSRRPRSLWLRAERRCRRRPARERDDEDAAARDLTAERMPLHLRRARVTRTGIEANTGICSGMFRHRYRDREDQ